MVTLIKACLNPLLCVWLSCLSVPSVSLTVWAGGPGPSLSVLSLFLTESLSVVKLILHGKDWQHSNSDNTPETKPQICSTLCTLYPGLQIPPPLQPFLKLVNTGHK